MLARHKRNMFISFRHDPRDLESVSSEIRLNIRRGLARLKCDQSNVEPSTSKMTKQLNDLTIDNLTSIDICNDLRSHYRTHEWRIRDVIYTKKIWEAICCNAHLFKDKIVLDVSCDMGILSLFCAIAGAKHVYALDTSNIVQLTRRAIADNNLSNKITVVKGTVASVDLPVNEVDIIVSTFFGQSLFCENRMDELIDARTKWLKPNGLIFPDACNYYIGALKNSMSCDRSNFWTHVHKFDMRPMIDAVNSEPYLKTIDMSQVATNACLIKRLNMYTVEKRDYKRFDAPFRLEVGANGCIGAFFTYFDIEFNEGVKPIKFSIQPGWPETYWRPMIFFISMNDLLFDNHEVFYGVFRMNAVSDDYRQMDWNIEIMHDGKLGGYREKWHFQCK